MRAREMLQEDYSQNLDSDLENILTGAKAAGAQQIDTQGVVNQLYQMGYSVDNNSIISLLSNSPLVQNATPETIIISGNNISSGTNDSAAQVADMAQKATDKIG